MAHPSPTRREALTALVAMGASLPLVGCSGRRDGPAPSRPPEPTSTPDPDEAVRRTALRGEEALLALHEATVARHPELGALLAPMTEHHRRHMEAVAGPARPGAGPSATAGTPSPTRTPTPGAPPVPADPAAALDSVRAAEQAAAADRLRDCLASTHADLAVLLASVGAAEAAHAALIERRA